MESTRRRWEPLSRRGSAEKALLHQGVPAHLDRPLRRWLEKVLSTADVDRLLLEMEQPGRGPHDDLDDLLDQFIWTTSGSELLDAVDWALFESFRRTDLVSAAQTFPAEAEQWSARDKVLMAAFAMTRRSQLDPGGLAGRVSAHLSELEDILDWGRSALVVSRHSWRLEFRTPEAVAQLAGQAVDREPAGHLADAWAAAYGRSPDPAKAYDEAIRAVESVTIPLILPKSNRATLGSVLAHLEGGGGARWQLAIPGKNGGDVGPVVSLLSMLWRGHVGRHAGGELSRAHEDREARMAVTAAVMLVEWFATGAIRGTDAVEAEKQ